MMWEVFKSDDQRHEEYMENIRVNNKVKRDEFVEKARQAGFSDLQIKVMTDYLSFSCHRHEVYAEGKRITARGV